VHGSKDRAKDASAERMHDLSCLRRCMRFVAQARRRSPPRRPPDIRCRRRASSAGGYPRKETDRPRSAFRRRPAKSAAFPKTRMSFTATTRGGNAKGVSLRPPRRLSRSRRPHPSRLGAVLWMGIARSRCGHPRIRELESTDAFSTLW